MRLRRIRMPPATNATGNVEAPHPRIGGRTVGRLRWRAVRDDGPVREALRLDRSRLAIGAAVPSAIGFAIPLVVGLIAGRVDHGVTAAVGALIVGFANLGGGYRVRSLTLLVTALAATVAALVGGLTGGSDVAAVVLMGVWGFAGGLLVALGTRPAFVGMLSTWALLLAADLHVHGVAAIDTAALIAAGGLLQTVVAVAAWPLRPRGPEQHAVSAAYRALAAVARTPTSEAVAASARALTAAAELIGDRPAAERERILVEQGEWIRLELAALGQARDGDVDALLSSAGDALDAIAAGRTPNLPELRSRAAAVAAPTVRDPALMLAARVAMDTGPPGTTLPGAPTGGSLRRALNTVHAQLTPRSSAFRHAVRLGAALMVAVVAYRVLPIGRGYWVPLTVLFVLKPDYLTTYSRGVGRAAGTMLGVVLAAAIVSLGHPSDPVIFGLLSALAFIAYALYPANYALFSVTLTVLVALMVDFAGGSAIGAVEERIVDTAIGAAIALGAFALWPTPEEPALRQRVTDLIAAHVRWLDAIVAGLADPAAYDPDAMHRERQATRVARANAEAALQRAAAEPAKRRLNVPRARAVLEALSRIDDSALVLAETAHDHHAVRADPVVAAWGRALHATLERLAADPTTVDPPDAETLALVAAASAAPDDVALGVIAAHATAILAALRGLQPAPTDRTP
jgi:uncharacterized membrane protein YccC